MSGTDDRVVNMQFDNAVFEKNLAQTMRSIEQLQKSLDFQNAATGIDKVNDAASKFSMEKVTAGIENVSGKFIALTTVGVAALTKITDAAFEAGSKVAHAFVIDPAKQGFQEYETKIGSIQTILANTARYGTKLPEVADNLDKLNDYADKTIYNFGDMTKNIGLFTNAGIKVGEATSMIKGFSNSAAASGTTAEGAAGAAYQLSQALSAGQIRLMDWRSLTNAGMGNKNMQDSLIQLAEKMGTLDKAGLKASDVQKDFNGSLEKGWLKADVMSNYLKIMAGDMDDAKIKSMGFTAEQVKGFREQQKMAEEAATKVRTFTQLTGTIKESVGSAWSGIFETVIGDFDTATVLFTSINNVVGDGVKAISEGIDKILKQWVKLGGRDKLITAFKEGFQAMGNVLKVIKEAFREFFPAKTADDLMGFTETLATFTHWLLEASKHLDGLKTVFRAVFAIFDIGWEILKQIYFTIATTVDAFSGLGSGVGNVTVKAAEWILKLHEMLIEGGKLEEWGLRIRQSINRFAESLKEPIAWLGELSAKIGAFFSSFDASKKAEDSLDRVNQRFGWLRAVGEWLEEAGRKILAVLDTMWDAISGWFKELGQKLGAIFQPGDFDAALDALNAGLLGGIVLMLKKFLDGMKDKKEGGDGIFDKIKTSLDQLTGTLKTMQQTLKATALMEIAIAIGVLTASLLILSMMDSGKLTAAMIAVAIGFLELVGVLELMSRIGGDSLKGGVQLNLLVGAMTGLATSALILAGALVILGTMDLESIGRGLVALGGGLLIMIGALKLMSEGNISGVLLASVAMVALAGAMNVFALALKIFGTMSWDEIFRGLAAFAGTLAIVVIAVNAMPIASTIAAGLAMIPLAVGITVLAGAMKIFGTMQWDEIGRGLTVLGGALAIIALAMWGMPLTLPITAAGLLLVGLALGEIVGVLKLMSMIKFGDMMKALGELGLLLVILAAGLTLMILALPGAIALGVAATTLGMMAIVLEKLGNMSLKEIAIGLGAIIALFLVIGVAALVMEPVIPLIFLLGVALGTVGIAFALFGLGAMLIAKAFEAIAAAGKAGTQALIDSLLLVLKAIPKFTSALISSLLDASKDMVESADLLIRVIVVLVGHILDAFVELLPKLGKVIVELVDLVIKIIIDKGPQIIEAGYKLLTMLLSGLYMHMGDLVIMAIGLIVKFATVLGDNAQKLVDAGMYLLASFISAIVNRMNDISALGVNVLLALISGMANNLFKIMNFAGDLIAALITGITNNVNKVIEAGVNAVVSFLNGLTNAIPKVGKAIASLIFAITNEISLRIPEVVGMGFNMIIQLFDGMSRVIRERSGELGRAMGGLGSALATGIGTALKEAIKQIAKDLFPGLDKVVDGVLKFFNVRSPSKLFYWIGDMLMQGFSNGIFENMYKPTEALADGSDRMLGAMSNTMSRLSDAVSAEMNISPVITPVLDLSNVQNGARSLNDLMQLSSLAAAVSFEQARLISTTSELDRAEPASPVAPVVQEVKFEQNNYSPQALSTNDIYRNTKSQIAMAKEELKIS